MPHICIRIKDYEKYAERLGKSLPKLCEIVGQHFSENPAYVSAEVVRQSELCLHRKEIDIEVEASPDADGTRAAMAGELATALVAFITTKVLPESPQPTVSAWVRIFDAAAYLCNE